MRISKLRYVMGSDPLAKAAHLAQKLCCLFMWRISHRVRIKPSLLCASAGFLLLLFSANPAKAQDVRVPCPANPSCTLTPSGGLPWGNANNVFIFTPVSPRVSIYIYVHNNNTTNAHTSQLISVYQTPFSQGIAPSLTGNADKWVQDTVTQNSTAGASCAGVNAANPSSPGASGLGSCAVMATFAAQIAIKISGAAPQSGSPDTFDLAIVQVPESSMGGSGSPGTITLSSGNSGTGAPPPLQVVSDNLGTAFTANTGPSNPGANTNLLSVINTAGSGKTLYFDSVTLYSQAAATIELVLPTAVGSSCTTPTALPMNQLSGLSTVSTLQTACSTNPTFAFVYGYYNLAAGQTLTVDLKGFISGSKSVSGLMVYLGNSVTGTVDTILRWYER